MANQLTEEEIRSHLRRLKYYWTTYGDITRDVGYLKILPILKEKFPDLLRSVEKIKKHQSNVILILEGKDFNE